MKMILKTTFTLISIIHLTSCGVSKSNSNNVNTAINASTNTSTKILSSCAQNKNADISVNISASAYSSGEINPNYIKIKFNYLSENITKAGHRVQFYKWKVSNNQIIHDQSPLSVSTYNLTTKGLTSYAVSEFQATDIKASLGYLVELNDPNYSYQVLKMIVLNSTGTTVVAQINMLIPQFAAQPAQYSYNNDGTIRAQDLQDLHPLKNVDTTGWSDTNYKNYFASYCF